MLSGAVEALDADGGRLVLDGPDQRRALEQDIAPALERALQAAPESGQVQRDDVWAIGVPIGFAAASKQVRGAIAVARAGRAFRDDEIALLPAWWSARAAPPPTSLPTRRCASRP